MVKKIQTSDTVTITLQCVAKTLLIILYLSLVSCIKSQKQAKYY